MAIKKYDTKYLGFRKLPTKTLMYEVFYNSPSIGITLKLVSSKKKALALIKLVSK